MSETSEAWLEFNAVIHMVNEQADDEGLWFDAQTAPEAYLQGELRKLHARVEKMHAVMESEYSVKQ
jgi:hypothetical protein